MPFDCPFETVIKGNPVVFWPFPQIPADVDRHMRWGAWERCGTGTSACGVSAVEPEAAWDFDWYMRDLADLPRKREDRDLSVDVTVLPDHRRTTDVVDRAAAVDE